MATKLTVELHKLHAKQLEVVNHQARYKVVNCGRRFGKTILATDGLANRLIDGQDTAYFSLSYKNVKLVWREAKRILKPVIVDKSETELRMELITGGVLECWTMGNAESALGRSYHHIVIDEAATVPDLGHDWNETISPMLTDRKGSAHFYSTPKGHNFFYTLHMRGLDPTEPEWQAFTFTSYDNPHIDPHEIDEQRRWLPDRTFRQEYLAEFLDDAGGVFRGVDAVSTLEKAEPIPGHEYVMGVDWARDYDFTVISVIDSTTRQQVHIERFNEISWNLQRKRLQALAEKYKPSAIVAEENSIGSPNIEALQEEGLPVVPFKTTSASKGPLIDALALAIEKQDITLLDDPVQKAELKAYQMERTPSGNWKYNAPAGGHDDTVIGLALAWHGVAQGSFIYFMVG